MFEKELRDNFERVRTGMKDSLEDTDVQVGDSDFKTFITDVGSDRKMLVITFPIPRATTEVSFVGVVMDEQPKFFTSEFHLMDENERKGNILFVQKENERRKIAGMPSIDEKSSIPDKTEAQYKLCRWADKDTHILIGNLKDSSFNEFVLSVKNHLSQTPGL